MAKKFDLKALSTTKTPVPEQEKQSKYSRYLEKEISTSVQEKSGEAKRINMAFTSVNYEMIQEESQRLGISMQYLINALVRIVDPKDVNAYVDSLPIKPNKNHVSRRKGSPSKRINFGIDKDTYEIIEKGSEKYEMTLTQYLNIVIGVYAQEVII